MPQCTIFPYTQDKHRYVDPTLLYPLQHKWDFWTLIKELFEEGIEDSNLGLLNAGQTILSSEDPGSIPD